MENNNSRMANTLRNSLIGILSQIILLVLTFVCRTVFIKVLGEEFLGINGLYTNVLSLLSLSELGVGNVLLFILYKPLAEGNNDLVIRYLKYFRKMYLLIATVILGLGLCFIPFLGLILNSNLPIHDLQTYYVLFLLNSVASYLFIYKSILIDASQKKYLISSITLVTTVIKSILQIVVLINFKSFYGYLTVQIIMTLVNNSLISFISDKKNKRKNLNVGEIDNEEKRIILEKIKSTFVYKIGTVLINNTENILISILVSTLMVGYYSNYILIISSVTSFISIVNSSVFSSIGNLIAYDNKKQIQDSFYMFVFIYHVVISMLAIGLYFNFNKFITIWIGEKYILSNTLILLICLKFYIGNISNPIWMFREASGMFEKVRNIIIIAAICNILFSVFFGNLYGIEGIVFGAIFARIVTIFWYEPNLLHKYLFNSGSKIYYKTQLRYFLFASGIFITMNYIEKFLPSNGISIVLSCLIILCMTLFLFFFVNFKDKNMKLILSKFKSLRFLIVKQK